MKALVVDDVGYIRHIVSRMFQKLGHAAVVADSARQALQVLGRDPSIDVVVTDLLMAEMDGIELFSASQKISRMTDAGNTCLPAFILMTAMRPGNGTAERDIGKLQLAKQLGFVDVLAKPFDHLRLGEALSKVQQNSASTPETKNLIELTDRLCESVRGVVQHQNSDVTLAAERLIVGTLEELKEISRMATEQRSLGHNQPQSLVN